MRRWQHDVADDDSVRCIDKRQARREALLCMPLWIWNADPARLCCEDGDGNLIVGMRDEVDRVIEEWKK